MATKQSANYNLTLQDNDEFVEIETTAANFKKLDEIIKGLEDEIDSNSSKITDLNNNGYSHPTYTSRTSGLYKITVDSTGHVKAATKATKSDITALGIPSVNTVYTHPSYTSQTSGLYKITVDSSGHVSGVSAVTKNDITALGIPGSNTTYSNATTSAAGLISASDKTKLDGIEAGANKIVVDDAATLEEFAKIENFTSSTNPISTRVLIMLLDENRPNGRTDLWLNSLEVTEEVTAGGTLKCANLISGNNCAIDSDFAAQIAFGFKNQSEGPYAVALGRGNIAQAWQTVTGEYADTSTSDKGMPLAVGTVVQGSVLVVGNGTADDNRSNVFRAGMDGQCYGLKAFLASGADFAEYFEWKDGNPDGADRRGRFVTLDGEKIRYANADDEYILGVVSTMGAFIGNAYSENWQGRYLTDVFGEWLTEEIVVPEEKMTYEVEEKDEETGETVIKTVEKVIPEHKGTRYVLNPDYDPTQEYVSREFRQEWSPIGFHGQLVTIDDGTCEVNGYCKSGDEGVATKSDTGYRVMARLDDTHIKILVK